MPDQYTATAPNLEGLDLRRNLGWVSIPETRQPVHHAFQNRSYVHLLLELCARLKECLESREVEVVRENLSGDAGFEMMVVGGSEMGIG